MFSRLFLTVLGMFLIMLPGFIARRRGLITGNMVTTMAKLHVNAIYPCLIFTSITRQFTLPALGKAWILPVCAGGIMLLGFVIGLIAVMVMRVKTGPVKSAMLFQCTINNYSFLPLTLILGLFDSEYVAALIFSTLGVELVIWTLGVSILDHKGLQWSHLRHLLCPPLLAMYAAGACLTGMYFGGIDPEVLTTPGSNISVIYTSLHLLGQGTVPIAMIIAGARIATLTWKDVRLPLAWVTTILRLIAIPLVAIAILNHLPLDIVTRRVLIIVAVMPVALGSMVYNELFGGDKSMFNGTVLLSHALALLTIPLLLALAL